MFLLVLGAACFADVLQGRDSYREYDSRGLGEYVPGCLAVALTAAAEV